MAKVEAAAELIRLGVDGRGQERFTTRTMLAVEARMARAGAALGAARATRSAARGRMRAARPPARGRAGGGVPARDRRLGSGAGCGVCRHRQVDDAGGGACGLGGGGLPGAGRGAVGIAAEGLEVGSGIGARTVASYLHAWDRGREALSARDVLVVDEAGMIGSRPMERLLSAARGAGAKSCCRRPGAAAGDRGRGGVPGAGGSARGGGDHHGAAAAVALAAGGDPGTGHGAHGGGAGALRGGRDGARASEPGCGQGGAGGRLGGGAGRGAGESAVILASTRAEVRDLNERARAALRASGALGLSGWSRRAGVSAGSRRVTG